MNAIATETWVFPPEPASTREARRRVAGVLESYDLLAATATAALIVSELTTNAVLHARTPFAVRLIVNEDTIRIEVHDETDRRPVRRYFSDESASGRGLRLVDELSLAWGVEAGGDIAGKTVWAELDVAGPSMRSTPLEFHQVDGL